MSIFLRLIGTFLMFTGFLGILAGCILFRLRQEDLGRMFMSGSFLGGGEIPDTPLLRIVSAMHANDPLKKRWAGGILVAGILLSIVGAAVA